MTSFTLSAPSEEKNTLHLHILSFLSNMQMVEGWKDFCEGCFFGGGGRFSWVMDGRNEGKVVVGVREQTKGVSTKTWTPE